MRCGNWPADGTVPASGGMHGRGAWPRGHGAARRTAGRTVGAGAAGRDGGTADRTKVNSRRPGHRGRGARRGVLDPQSMAGRGAVRSPPDVALGGEVPAADQANGVPGGSPAACGMTPRGLRRREQLSGSIPASKLPSDPQQVCQSQSQPCSDDSWPAVCRNRCSAGVWAPVRHTAAIASGGGWGAERETSRTPRGSCSMRELTTRPTPRPCAMNPQTVEPAACSSSSGSKPAARQAARIAS